MAVPTPNPFESNLLSPVTVRHPGLMEANPVQSALSACVYSMATEISCSCVGNGIVVFDCPRLILCISYVKAVRKSPIAWFKMMVVRSIEALRWFSPLDSNFVFPVADPVIVIEVLLTSVAVFAYACAQTEGLTMIAKKAAALLRVIICNFIR